MSNENPNKDELHDRLLEGALREVVGGETPPDLSEQIMFAATGEQAEKLSTPLQGEKAMTSRERQTRLKRNFLIGLATAACLLLAGSMFLPGLQRAKQTVTSNDRQEDNAAKALLIRKDFKPRNVEQERDFAGGQAKKKDSVNDSSDFDALVDLVRSTVDESTWADGQDQEGPPTTNLSLDVSQSQQVVEEGAESLAAESIVQGTFRPRNSQVEYESSMGRAKKKELRNNKNAETANVGVMLAVEPQIISGAEVEERFDFADVSRSGKQQSAPPYNTPAHANEKPLGNAYAASPATSSPLPGVSGREAGQRFRVDAKPKSDAHWSFAEDFGTPTTAPAEAPVQVAAAEDRHRQRYYFGASGPGGGEFGGGGGGLGGRGYGGEFGATDRKSLYAFDQSARGGRAQADVDHETFYARQPQNAPNDYLATDLVEIKLRRNVALKKISDLQSKLKDINQQDTGGRGNKRAILVAELNELVVLDDKLRRKIDAYGLEFQHGEGPDASGDKYTRIHENPFVAAEGAQAVSTFSIDVDTASYANVRQFLMQAGQLPPPDAVRIEELVNYFDYEYTAPTGDTPFASHVEVAGCPWHADHRLVRVGIKGREIETANRPQSNLVFLIDVSGSMNEPAKLPLLVEGMKLLTRELGENDRVAIVVYASSEGLALPSTRGDKQQTILSALDKLRAGGSTAGGAGIKLAYKIAQENFIEGGVNRVILATDGDFNVGITSPGALEALAEKNAKETGVFLTVLGFGRGNLNDAMMEQISGKGNGNYHYVDNQTEAQKVLVAEMTGTLVTIAKDVKIQIEFNPAEVAAYRLIGYENRMLETQDFNDDKKDAGEIGAGHTVTAIYEIVPAGKSVNTPPVDPLKYQQRPKAAEVADPSGELLTLKIRYKQPDSETSTKLEFPITDGGQPFAVATDELKFASAVASFGMLLRGSEHQGTTSYSAIEEIAADATGEDANGYRAEFLQLVRRAKELAGE